MPQQHSTIGGHLTITSPKPEDMRLEPSLNVMLEGSLSDLPNAVNAEETRERDHHIPEERPQRTSFETLIEGSPENHIKAKSESNIQEAPRRIQRTRETSREDAVASTHQFFAAVHERNRGAAAEEPIVTSSDRNENDVVIPSNIPITPDIPEAEATETETRSLRTFLPSGSPSRPTATATCQPRTRVQCISEGQINEPTQEDICSTVSSATETSVLVERAPEELGQEWRILHPFEIPGVRFPTDATPPNQRRLAENDALVELIHCTYTLYLKDTPMWGQRDYQLYPLNMVIPSIEEEEEEGVEVEEDRNGLVKDLQKDQMEDWEEDSPMKMEERLEER